MNFRGTAGRSALLASLVLTAGLATAAPSFANHQIVTGITNEDPTRVVQFAVGNPGTLTTANGASVTITFPGADDNLVGIDYRPRTNTLYGMTDTGQVYLLTPVGTPVTGFTATAIGTPAANPDDVDSGLDFNPVPDAIRLNNVNDQNFRFSPNTGGLVMQDGNLAFAAGDPNFGDNPEVGGAAYTNNVDGTATTTLFDIEAFNNALVTQNPPNSGTLNTVGTLPGGDITSTAGFDIETQTGSAYAALQTSGETFSRFYRLDLTNGAALNSFGRIGSATPPIEGISLRLIPQLQFSNVVTSTREGTAATVTVTRQGELGDTATVNYATESAAGDTAAADDYTPTTGTLTFAPGDAQETITIPTTDDTADETDETFTVRLSMPSTSVNLPAPPTTKVNIVDNDDALVAVTPAPPVPGTTPVIGKPGAAPFGLISVATQRIGRRLRARFICDEGCFAKLTLKLGRRTLDTQNATASGANGSTPITFRLSASEVRAVRRAAKGRRSAKLNVRGAFSDPNGTTSSSVRFQLG